MRVIVLAATEEDAEHALARQPLRQSYHVGLRPLAYRSGEIDQLLDRMFAARDAAHLRTADLLVENQEALRMCSWPKNLAQLHTVADAIVAHEASPNEGGYRNAGRPWSALAAQHRSKVGSKRTFDGPERPAAQLRSKVGSKRTFDGPERPRSTASIQSRSVRSTARTLAAQHRSKVGSKRTFRSALAAQHRSKIGSKYTLDSPERPRSTASIQSQLEVCAGWPGARSQHSIDPKSAQSARGIGID